MLIYYNLRRDVHFALYLGQCYTFLTKHESCVYLYSLIMVVYQQQHIIILFTHRQHNYTAYILYLGCRFRSKFRPAFLLKVLYNMK